jgi:hypothetical protein
MKTQALALIIALTTFTTTHAQISLVGASVNTASGKIDLIQWNALDSLSVTVTPTLLDGYFFATSAFDAFNSKYYITGISGDSAGLYAYNTTTDTEELTVGSLYSNISEFDMSTGKMYNLIMETEEYISIYEFDILTNTDSLIGIIYEPGATGIVADAIGFDSNNGIIYYVGFTNDPALCLYAIPVRDTVFSYTKTILSTTDAFNNITCVNYDNVNEVIYALNDTYDSLFNFTGRYIIEIDKITGDVIERGELVEFPYYVGGSSSFDQISGTFLLAAIDTVGNLKMVAFDTYTDTYVSGFIPSLVSEIVCDNSSFSKLAYGTTAIQDNTVANINIYPNPASDILSIEHDLSGPLRVQITTTSGQLVYSQQFPTSTRIDINIASFAPGVYLLEILSREGSLTKKIVLS